MVSVQPRHRKLIDRHLAAGERVVAILHTETGKSGASAVSSTGGGLRRYVEERQIVEKGVNGVFDLFDTWLVLTDRRLAFFKGAWFTLAPKPKQHLLDVEPDCFTVAWRPEPGLRDSYLLHFTFPDDQHLVVMAEPEDADVFLEALGERAQRI